MGVARANDHPFNWEHYCKILSAGLEAGYRYVRFIENVDGKRIYLRHDIEREIETSFLMASIEHEMGIGATYYVLLRSANYNPAERRTVHMLHEISEMGHDIGLHFSLIDHPAAERPHDLAALIRDDAALLSRCLGYTIRTFSFHNPGDRGQFSIHVDGLTNAYADQFFRDAHYLSDSNVHWRNGCPCDVLGSSSREVIQILTHPSAFAECFSTDGEVLTHFLGRKIEDLLAYNIAQNRVLLESGLPMEDVLASIQDMDDSS